MTYTSNNYEVMAGKKIIARSYLGTDGKYEVKILQGMPRVETMNKIRTDCPAFIEANQLPDSYYPKLFTK